MKIELYCDCFYSDKNTAEEQLTWMKTLRDDEDYFDEETGIKIVVETVGILYREGYGYGILYWSNLGVAPWHVAKNTLGKELFKGLKVS